jgi:predicted Zn-dependent protease
MNDLEQLQAVADTVVDLVAVQDRADEAASIEANVLVARRRHGLTRFANSFVHQHVGEDTRTVLLTLAVDGRTATASTTATGDDALEDLVVSTVERARLQPVDPHWPGATPPADLLMAEHADLGTAAAEPDARAEIVKGFVDADPVLSAAGYVDTETDQVAFASSAGQRVAASSTRATVDGIHQTPTSAGAGHQTSLAVADLDGPGTGATAADLARRSARFVDVDPGDLEVVLGPEAVASIFTFLAVYGFNAKAHLEGSSFARVGEQQFDAAINVRNDPADPRSIGLPFDVEGTPRQSYDLISDGVTRALAHDRRTALRAGETSTGDALPGGASMGAIPTSVVMPGGDTPPQDLIASVRRGLLVTQFHYCRVLDPKTLVVTGLTRNGTFLVEDGEVSGAVGNLRFTQSFIEALAPGNVLGIGDDDRHAAGEFGAGMVICPSLRLQRWSFTGGAKG